MILFPNATVFLGAQGNAMKKLLLIASLILFIFPASGQLLINEISCSNTNTITDAFGEYEDWVEIYNNSAVSMNMSGYYLSDNPNNLQKYQIPTVPALAAGARQMVYCSSKDSYTAGQIHTNFKLRQSDGNL